MACGSSLLSTGAGAPDGHLLSCQDQVDISQDLITSILPYRIPSTKSEIEANFKRKKLLGEFNSKMRQLNTKDLDDMTYRLAVKIIISSTQSLVRRALERLREEYKADSESLAQSEAISIMRSDRCSSLYSNIFLILSLEDIQEAKDNGDLPEKYFPESESLHI